MNSILDRMKAIWSSHRALTIYFIILICIVIIALVLIVKLSALYRYYYDHYQIVNNRLSVLENIGEENLRLKKELFVLNQETERLKKTLAGLMEKEGEINEDSLPIGGGKLHLFYQRPIEIIDQMKEELIDLQNSVKEYNNFLKATPDIWPLVDKGNSFISSLFGWRIDPFTGKQEFHEGLDIGVWYNTPVLATAEGRVTYAGWLNGYGHIVKIEHGSGFETRYGHLNKIKVKKDEFVKKGEVIGYSGNSGRSTGPHLHYEIRKNDIPVDPLNYIGLKDKTIVNQ